MRTFQLLAAFTFMALPLAAQTNRLSGPPLIERHSHVGEGALIGAAIGGFAGAFVGLADHKHICSPRLWLCQGPGGPIISMIGGLAIGSMGGGATGAVIGAFVHSSGGRADLGVSVRF